MTDLSFQPHESADESYAPADESEFAGASESDESESESSVSMPTRAAVVRTVSGIEPNPRKPGRFSLLLDGEEFATLSIDAIERLHLATGMRVNETLAAAIEREAAVLATFDRALNMLAFRARSASELRRLLIRKDEPADQVDLAIARLQTSGLLDDRSFARQFARSKAVGAGLSKRRVQQELSRRGVDRAVAKEAIDEVYIEERVDESESIERVARKKLRSLLKVDPPTRRRRLYGFLARRGYDGDDIAKVIRVVLATNDIDDSELDTLGED